MNGSLYKKKKCSGRLQPSIKKWRSEDLRYKAVARPFQGRNARLKASRYEKKR